MGRQRLREAVDRERLRERVGRIDRRRAGAVVGLVLVAALLAALTGNLGFLLGLDAKHYEAERAVVEEDTVAAAGYSLADTDERVNEQRVGPLGFHRVAAESKVAEYRRTVEVPVLGKFPAAALVVVSTPQARLLGQARNPVERTDTRDLMERVEEDYGEFEVDRKVGERSIRTLGREATVEEFRGTTTIADLVTVDVAYQVVVVPHEGDYVIAVGIYPTFLDVERRYILAMMRAIEHDGD